MVVDCETRFAIEVAIARRIPYVLSVPFLVSNVLTPYSPFARSYVPRSFPTPHTGLPYEMNLFQAISNRLFRLRTLAMFFRLPGEQDRAGGASRSARNSDCRSGRTR